ncbi:MAG: TIGR02679 family protein [Jiangellaceae bacterium]
MGIDQARLDRLLGGPETGWLVDRIRRRIELGEPLDITVTLSGSTPAQRDAAHRLLGRAPRAGSSLAISLPALDDVLRRSGVSPAGLGAAVVALRGPVVVRSAAAAQIERHWDDAFAPVAEVVATQPALAAWYERLRRSGLVRRLAGSPDATGPLLADLAAVVAVLPAGGEQLARFAARVTADAHALDDDRPLATLALGAARALGDLPAGTGAEWRREVWASVGLLRDELSATVLTLGLPGDAISATGRALRAWHEAGQPVALTLRQLVRDPPALALAGVTVSVCEGPVVVSTAADDLGTSCQPLVCTSGQPSAAAVHLLRILTREGATLRYHGDFDWGGLRIAGGLYRRFPMRPWRYDAAAYNTAVSARLGRHLTGPPVDATWDPALARAMQAASIRIEEELVLDELIGDLSDV